MEIVSLLVSVIGLGVSVWAVVKARSAQGMAQAVIDQKNQQEDNERLRELVRILVAAKAATMRRIDNAPKSIAAGRTLQADIRALRDAQDALKARFPLSLDGKTRLEADNAASELEAAIQAISNQQGSDEGWRSALAILQIAIPRLEQEERALRDRTILAVR